MLARVLSAGAHLVYTPDALVWHRHRREMDALRACLFGYGVGLYSFLTKRLIEEHDWNALLIGARWWLGPMVKAAYNALRGRAALPPSLLWQEAYGAFFGPVRLWWETVNSKR